VFVSWKRVRIGAALLFAIEIAFFCFVAGMHGWIVPVDKPTTSRAVVRAAATLVAVLLALLYDLMLGAMPPRG